MKSSLTKIEVRLTYTHDDGTVTTSTVASLGKITDYTIDMRQPSKITAEGVDGSRIRVPTGQRIITLDWWEKTP